MFYQVIAAASHERTNSDRLDLDTLLDMCRRRVVSILVLKNLPTTQGVDEGCTAYICVPLASCFRASNTHRHGTRTSA